MLGSNLLSWLGRMAAGWRSPLSVPPEGRTSSLETDLVEIDLEEGERTLFKFYSEADSSVDRVVREMDHSRIFRKKGEIIKLRYGGSREEQLASVPRPGYFRANAAVGVVELSPLRKLDRNRIMASHPMREVIFDAINRERAYQDANWGGPSHDDTETEENWVKYIREYASGEGRAENYEFETRMIKVAALAVAALESFTRIKDDRSSVMREINQVACLS